MEMAFLRKEPKHDTQPHVSPAGDIFSICTRVTSAYDRLQVNTTRRNDRTNCHLFKRLGRMFDSCSSLSTSNALRSTTTSNPIHFLLSSCAPSTALCELSPVRWSQRRRCCMLRCLSELFCPTPTSTMILHCSIGTP